MCVEVEVEVKVGEGEVESKGRRATRMREVACVSIVCWTRVREMLQ